MEWKPLVYKKADGSVFDLSSTYLVSNTGRIWSIRMKREKPSHKRNVPLKGQNRYMFITVKVDGCTKNIRIHRAVASVFCEGFETNYDVDHIDGDIYNNNSSNLRWLCENEHRILSSKS